MSHIPKRDPERPVDQKAESPDELHREKCFEDALDGTTAIDTVLDRMPLDSPGDVDRRDEAGEHVESLRQVLIAWRDGP